MCICLLFPTTHLLNLEIRQDIPISNRHCELEKIQDEERLFVVRAKEWDKGQSANRNEFGFLSLLH
ncbi:hypothetical protein I7I50_10917 [Histoplasma capsulatum G186AR]|uniref:Uncharacterized protein n=1 Tax=Ajellomyces capsulatus TaxID=5037 RepID=A0A8H8D6P9_AJECA|nr:hypothetical protein I7I52_02155 [Histoplasma capsulatum]QSS69579.1 hypothetical protein I7I50_10917 [Histoplasma capsulatum G186AR]